MKLLVTGGCGFIGSEFCRYFTQQHGYNVTNLDVLTYAASPISVASIANRKNYHFVKGDICDTALVTDLLEQYDIDWIIHMAAESHVDRSISSPNDFIRTNVNGTCSVLQAARAWLDGSGRHKRDKFRFLHVSTDEVYGDLDEVEPAFTESSPYRPSSPYSASKAASDHLVKAWGRTYGLPVLITNCSNNYGPFQFPDKLIPLTTISAISGARLPVYGEGKNIRDWLHVTDHVLALEKVLKCGTVGETYNIGGNEERQNIEVVGSICDILDRSLPLGNKRSYRDQIEFVSDRPGHDLRYAINPQKIMGTLDWKPLRRFETALDETVQWYASSRDWWKMLDRKK